MLKLYEAVCQMDRKFRWVVCMFCGTLANLVGEGTIAAMFFAASLVITINSRKNNGTL